MRFRNECDKGTASNLAQISEKVDMRSGKKAWALHGKSKITDTWKGEKDEKQSQEHAYHFLWHQGDCLQRILHGIPNTQSRKPLWCFTAIEWKYAKISALTLATKELALSSRQLTTWLFLFHQGIFDQKQHESRLPPTVLAWLVPPVTFLCFPDWI
jgi:hypothetical protein